LIRLGPGPLRSVLSGANLVGTGLALRRSRSADRRDGGTAAREGRAAENPDGPRRRRGHRAEGHGGGDRDGDDTAA
jgi:hypothetical protein